MRVLITGGRGFLGRAVTADLIARGHGVTVLSHTAGGDGTVLGDLRDRERLTEVIAQVKPEIVCHLAALTNPRDSFANPLTYFDVNVGGTLNLLHALAAAGEPARIVFTSTSAVYGSARPGHLSEDMVPSPESPYAVSKVTAEQLLASYVGTGAIGATSLRCFNIAGAVSGFGDPDPTRIISAALRAAAGVIPHVSVNGDGSAVREFTHVLDVAAAVGLAAESSSIGDSRVLNVGTGNGITMMEVIRAAEKVTGREIAVVHRPPAREPHTLIADGRRVREVLGWEAQRSSIEEIVADSWAALGA
ncbi:UDP-glucose 4-epimerase [Allocatelliglobosispora scoriae]|uniref:UDP-glucose 4-epimerase n=1 Tax=Allocatelliglobosispora scoriae TaxID=643052 RepID=A0A841BRJ9_9ACTN|nr:NAD-dependent epimerase/dehydratase family protein [Allocatelliglobosispora scoriae]MBB5869543.1 UDP-glucose 4-epimerase [Allocatelliglobosispora scoriae]